MLAPGLSPHDAVSNDARQMASVLRGANHEVRLFAPHARGIDEPVGAPGDIEEWLQSPRDLLIYHYCVGWEFALALLRRLRVRRVVRYHNITPPEFFADWSPGYVSACAEGRAQLDAFARLDCELVLGDSAFNIEDFTMRGMDPARCEVLAPFHEVDELRTIEADTRRVPAGSPLLLMVGRMSPNKGYLDLIESLAACVAGRARDAHLLIVGKLDPNLASYGDAVTALIADRGLESRVTWLQDAGGAELRGAYERADALVMLSGHEGFCVPVVEAMALGTPVVALASSALPGTLGDAGLLWENADPHVIAESVARIADDAPLRNTLRQRGRERYESTFAPSVLGARLLDLMQRRFAA